MNKIDKKWYKSLRFLSRFTSYEVLEFKNKHTKQYHKKVPIDVENTLRQFGYLLLNGNHTQAVTQSGLQQLRDLEDIRRKDLTLISSVIAIVISIVALAKSFGWF